AGSLEVNQRPVDARARAGAHRRRTAFSTRVLLPDLSSIRYTPPGTAAPRSSRPSHANETGPGAPGPSWIVRTKVPFTRNTRNMKRPAWSRDTGRVAPGLKGFGRTGPIDRTRGAGAVAGIATRTCPYSRL